METTLDYPESPMDPDDLDATPCRGCGQILEEGKAFELSGLRWHIDCFRCSTCNVLLDSDANLLLLGDGSLICNNCTYSCSACGNKIEDLAILTGDHAYCAPCFKCRNCKKKIENLRYARTSQGMFCMDCHDALMARRRKKSGKGVSRKHHLDKSLPSLPPHTTPAAGFSSMETSIDAPTELPGSLPPSRINSAATNHRDISPAPSEREARSELGDVVSERKMAKSQSDPPNYQQETSSRNTTRFEMPADEFKYVPMALDPTIIEAASPMGIERSEKDEKTSEPPKSESVTLGSDYFNVKEKSSKRKIAKDSRLGELSKQSESQPNSPVVSTKQEESLEKRRAVAAAAAAAVLETREVPSRSQSEQDKFRLQEAPRRRRSVGQQYVGPSSKESFPILSLDSTTIDLSLTGQFTPPGPLREQHVNIGQSDSAKSSQLATPTQKSSLLVPDSRHSENSSEIPTIPKRGDSLQKPQLVPRKEVPGSRTASHESNHETIPSSAARGYENSLSMNGGLVISRPIESPVSKSVNATTTESGDDSANGDSFISPRAAPPRPADSAGKHKTKGSVGTIRSDSRNGEPGSPGVNRFQHSETDEGRTTEDGGPGFFTRTFSKSVRHARSHSDRGSRNSREHKWPKTPVNGSGHQDRDLASPTMSSPDPKASDSTLANQEIARLRHESILERQRVQELEAKVAELEGTLEGKASINKVNSELQEKRSTIVVLDSQKEIVIRQLEVITEHLQAAKSSGGKLDFNSMQQKMLTDFVDELNKLRDSYTPQIEALLQQKSDLKDDLDQLIQKRDRAAREFEQLSMKNAQLADLNNQLVGTIQELQSKIHSQDQKGAGPGLGIYTHHYPKDKTHMSFDSRDLRDSISDLQYSGSTVTDHSADAATILHAPQVVNIQKGQASKRSYWKKEGMMAKGMKGLKGAFTSTDTKTGREGSVGGLTEGIPYGQMASGGEPMPVTTLSGDRQGLGFFTQPKGRTGPKPPIRDNFANIPAADPSIIFGSELEMRAVYEGVDVPYVVTRCIKEVELRGMYSEGIYRKSGSKTQTDTVKEMFQRGDDSEISDQDFDINAVASALKQYFRNLPTPLLTFALYDRLLEATKLPHPECIVAIRNCMIDLPPRHRDTLEYLIFHLERVVKLQEHNLMTSMNCGVVFAPTIMMGEDPQRDLQNTQQKNWLITFLIDHCNEIFLHSGEGLNGSA